MNKIKLSKTELLALKPCSEGAEYAIKFRTMREAWASCPRSDWMLWILARVRPLTQKEAVAFASKCALQALGNFEKVYSNDKRPRQAVEMALAWLSNSCENARSAAWSAAESAARSAARSAAESAESAAWSAESAAWSAESAARSAAESAESARSAAESARSARSAAQKEQADFLREIIGNPF